MPRNRRQSRIPLLILAIERITDALKMFDADVKLRWPLIEHVRILHLRKRNLHARQLRVGWIVVCTQNEARQSPSP